MTNLKSFSPNFQDEPSVAYTVLPLRDFLERTFGIHNAKRGNCNATDQRAMLFFVNKYNAGDLVIEFLLTGVG